MNARAKSTHLDSEASLRKVSLFLLLPLRHFLLLILRQSSSDGARLLWSEIERNVFLALVEDAELRALVGVDDGEDACDRFADVVAVVKLVSNAEFRKPYATASRSAQSRTFWRVLTEHRQQSSVSVIVRALA